MSYFCLLSVSSQDLAFNTIKGQLTFDVDLLFYLSVQGFSQYGPDLDLFKV